MFWVKLATVLLSLAESFLYVFIMSYLQHANLVIGSSMSMSTIGVKIVETLPSNDLWRTKQSIPLPKVSLHPFKVVMYVVFYRIEQR